MGEIIKRPGLLTVLPQLFALFGAQMDSFGIVGVRLDDNSLDDDFDDFLLPYDTSEVVVSQATTVPGKYYTDNPVTYKGVTGAGRLVRGYYKNSHIIGIHGRRYPDYAHEAWLQCGVLKFARDVNKDGIIEVGEPVQEGADTGFNIHRCGRNEIAKYVGKNSAGCQVSSDAKVHEYAISMYKRSARNGKAISYLLTEKEDWEKLFGCSDVRKFILTGEK